MPSGFGQRVFSAASVTLLMTNDSSILADFFTSSLRYFMQLLNTICISTCFLHKQDLLSRSFACFTEKGFKLLNFLWRIFTSGCSSRNSLKASDCAFPNTCFACFTYSSFPMRCFKTSFLSPVGRLAT